MSQQDFRSPGCSSMPPWRRAKRSRSSATRAIISAMCCGSPRAIRSWCSTAATANGRPRSRAANGRTACTIMARTRPQDRLPDLAYVFAPLKHARLDYMVQKAVEMGASSLAAGFDPLYPGLEGQWRADARQCDRGRRAVRHPQPCHGRRAGDARSLSGPARRRSACWFSATRPPRSQIRCRRCRANATAAGGIDILIGPEGGFAEEERGGPAATAANPEAFAGAADAARRYRRGGRAGAGPGGARRLDRRAARAGRLTGSLSHLADFAGLWPIPVETRPPPC